MLDYNFCKLHKAPRLTPAMAAGVTDRLWEVADIVSVLEKLGAPGYFPSHGMGLTCFCKAARAAGQKGFYGRLTHGAFNPHR